MVHAYEVLDRSEGPKCVWNMIRTQFPTPPKVIIYDAACQLAVGTVHTRQMVLAYPFEGLCMEARPCVRKSNPVFSGQVNGRVNAIASC